MTLRDYSPCAGFAASQCLGIFCLSPTFDTPLSHGIDPREAAFYEANPYPALTPEEKPPPGI